MKDIVPTERIISRIFEIRGRKVMLDRDLAELYEVETKYLKQSVRRNMERFPSDFMFELSDNEFEILRSQIATSSWGGVRYPPFAFTEQGVAMLSSVLKSKRAVQVNIQIMRTFTLMRTMVAGYKELKARIEAMEGKYDKQFQVVFTAIKNMIEIDEKPKRKIGY